ncbi:MAG TPA: DUF6340 family protein [Eudoraea sp.]|nr:DUF6340 family protein [Eudoraea sp.]
MRKYLSHLLMTCMVLGSTACNSTKQLGIHTMEPAAVDLSKTIKRIGIINSSIPAERAEYKDRLDQILSVQDQELAKQGTDAAINGLFDELTKDQRFEDILLLEDVPEVMKGMDQAPSEGTWNTIETLCRKHGVDAIFSLAYYDTDTKISLKKTKMEQRNLMRERVELKAHELTLETLIENGWRIYDPGHKEVIDEFTFNDQIMASAKGISPMGALRAITDRKDSVLQKSMTTGSAYGSRLHPSEQVIYRDYYVRGTDNFMAAEKRTLEEDYRGAAALWEQDVEHSNAKIRAKACHNIAVIHEFNGALDLAMEWVTRALTHHNNKRTAGYLKLLQHRISQEEVIREQLTYTSISK